MSITNYTTHKQKNKSISNTDNQLAESKSFIIQKTNEESIIMSLLNLADIIKKIADVHCQYYGITMNQYHIMLYLANDPNIAYIQENKSNSPILASQLADALNVSRPNITNLLNLLIEKKLVSQVKDKIDSRKKFLVITEEGWVLLEKIQPRRMRLNKELLLHLGDNERQAFLSTLQNCHYVLFEKECMRTP